MCVCVSDLPVCSPLCHAALKTLQRWEQLLLKRLEIFGGPPSRFICSQLLEESVSSGPALLRHKALFEPSNTPFRYGRLVTRTYATQNTQLLAFVGLKSWTEAVTVNWCFSSGVLVFNGY